MSDYLPAYRRSLPFTLERFTEQLEELRAIHAYAIRQDDLMVLDELFCRIVPLEHQLVLWNTKTGGEPRVQNSVRDLNRALKWAWLAREEDEHANGMYADKLKEALSVLGDVVLFLESRQPPKGMTEIQAEALANTIRARLPQAEVEVKREESQGTWIVEARNPRRKTSQIFHDPGEFEDLLAGRIHP